EGIRLASGATNAAARATNSPPDRDDGLDSAADPMEDLRPKTILFCAVLALAIALSVLLRGRRAVHWLFAAFAADVAFWYGSQSLASMLKETGWDRATAFLTVLLPQFAVPLFQAIVPLEPGDVRGGKLAKYALAAGAFMLVLEASPYHDT